jgi:hypothetical protein
VGGGGDGDCESTRELSEWFFENYFPEFTGIFLEIFTRKKFP